MRVRKVNSNDVKIHDSVQVKLKTAGATQVVQFTARNNKSCPVRNLSKDTYLDTKTGEIKQKKKSENRYQWPKSVQKSINRLIDLIRCNATDPAKCKWLTVTYADVMTDGKQAYLDAKLFLRKLKRYLAKQSNIIFWEVLYGKRGIPASAGSALSRYFQWKALETSFCKPDDADGGSGEASNW